MVEFVGHDGKKVIWGVVDDHVIEEATDHDEIGLRGFICLTKTRRGWAEKGSVSFHIY